MLVTYCLGGDLPGLGLKNLSVRRQSVLPSKHSSTLWSGRHTRMFRAKA